MPDHIDMYGGWEGWIYSSWDFPREVIERWDALSLNYGDLSIFISYGWFRLWWKAFGKESTLFVVVLKSCGEIKAIFPCCIKPSPGNGSDFISSLSNAHTCHFDFIIDPDMRRRALSHFLEILHQRKPQALMHFEYLSKSGDNVISFTSELSCRRIPFHHYSQPWAPWLERTEDWAAFCNSLPGRLRNTLKRNRKKAEARGEFHFEIIERSGHLDKILDTVFDTEYRNWKGRAGTAIKCREEVEKFYRQLAHWAMEQNHLLLFLLKLNGIPVASDFCLRLGHTVFLLKPGYDESFHHLSPGNLLRLEVFKYLYRHPELSVYNFLGACEPWKMEWTQNSHEYGYLVVYPKSLKGWSRYMLRYGWKDFLKKFHTLRQVKSWLDRRGN